MRRRWYENGQSMPYFVALLAFVLLPLMALTVDVVRALYLQNHLQAAVDAACEAAAQALDTKTFLATGTRRIDLGLGAGYAAREFAASVADRGIVGYSPSLTSMSLVTATSVRCTGSASLNLLIPVTPPLTVRAVTVSEMRVLRR